MPSPQLARQGVRLNILLLISESDTLPALAALAGVHTARLVSSSHAITGSYRDQWQTIELVEELKENPFEQCRANGRCKRRKETMKELRKVTTLLLLALPAFSQKPAIQFIPLTTTVAPTAGVCGFDILVTPQPGRPNAERLILFANSAIIAGPQFVTLKNLSTGKTIDLNVSGPGVLTFSGITTTLVFMGAGELIFHPLPADVAAAAGLPRVFLLHGQLVTTLDQQGNIISIQSVNGTIQDLCQLLQ
jgi:hypothetical protein